MRLTFWGAARTVTGSKHLLELDNGKRILLDCGLFQGRRSESRERNSDFGFDAASIDIVLLSHAHIDHCGLLPKLWREGFRGAVYSTHATRDLCSYLLHDSAHIQEKDAEFVNKRNRKKGKPEIEVLYDHDDVDGILGRFRSVSYDHPFKPTEGVEVEYRDAGHILGSASIHMTIIENGRTTKLGFTGDIGSPNRPILRDPQPMKPCDYLISESTYGGKTHEPPEEAKGKLAEIVKRTASRGGKLIIPAFAVGRTQEIVHILDQLEHEGALPRIPVYVDSPLAVNATNVFIAHPECFDQELRNYMRNDPEPFGFNKLNYIRKVELSKELNMHHEPMVIISASGMCEAGRILHHLRNNIEDPRNTVMMVGYCAEHTLGKRIIDQHEEVRIFGQMHPLRCEVAVMNHYSAHADEPGMVDFISNFDPAELKNIFLVHGDLKRQEKFKDALSIAGYDRVAIPDHGQSFQLT
ncbi:MAG: MBL fold metallo-hydrolase [Rhodothermaceae bacterium]|nr:MBL fold metallo-hydrolase [Rhodothermaceae bacterium]